MSEITADQARAMLVAAGVTGPHRSHSRANAIGKINSMLEGDPNDTFGLSGLEKYSAGEVLEFVAELTGCNPDIEALDGHDVIDPDRTVAGIEGAARRLGTEARRGATLLVATGHPTGLLEHHIRVVDAFRDAGGKLVRPREEEKLFSSKSGRDYEVRYVGGVGCVADWGALRHTHSSIAMEALLEGGPHPDIVMADHGFAGAAVERGIPTVAVMDINDPALAVAWAEQRDISIIPMDDNRPPRSYEASWRLFRQLINAL
jgi:hypothetical protein